MEEVILNELIYMPFYIHKSKCNLMKVISVHMNKTKNILWMTLINMVIGFFINIIILQVYKHMSLLQKYIKVRCPRTFLN